MATTATATTTTLLHWTALLEAIWPLVILLYNTTLDTTSTLHYSTGLHCKQLAGQAPPLTESFGKTLQTLELSGKIFSYEKSF